VKAEICQLVQDKKLRGIEVQNQFFNSSFQNKNPALCKAGFVFHTS
jgi:hypothetical protein